MSCFSVSRYMWIPSICKPQRWKKIFNWGPLRMKPSCGGVHSHHANFKQDWKSIFKCRYILIFVSEEADLYFMSILDSFSDLPCYAWSMSPDLAFTASLLEVCFLRKEFWSSKKQVLGYHSFWSYRSLPPYFKLVFCVLTCTYSWMNMKYES